MTNFLTALAHLAPILAVGVVIGMAAWKAAGRNVARAFDEAGVRYGPREKYGPIDSHDYQTKDIA